MESLSKWKLLLVVVIVNISVIYFVDQGRKSDGFQIFPTLRTNFKLLIKTKRRNRTMIPWHLRDDKMDYLDENVNYRKFNIEKMEEKIRVNVILVVSSAPVRFDRRMAIRETWWQLCSSNNRISIQCVFLTDFKTPKTLLGKKLLYESKVFEDIHFQQLTGGHDFGKRFLYHMLWAVQNYDFDYFVRMDDDYFVCMDRFLNEVPVAPVQRHYHWGYVHCIENIVRPEESLILLSHDLVEMFIGQDPNTMLCNRWADQMIAVWNNELNLTKFYHHDVRLHHDPPAQFVEAFKSKQNVCTDYIGIHGSYSQQMRMFWKHRGPPSVFNKSISFNSFTQECSYPSYLNWTLFSDEWKVEPRLCKDDPDWGGSHGTVYIGRQGEKKRR